MFETRLDSQNTCCVERKVTPDIRAYLVSSAIAALLMVVFLILLPAAGV